MSATELAGRLGEIGTAYRELAALASELEHAGAAGADAIARLDHLLQAQERTRSAVVALRGQLARGYRARTELERLAGLREVPLPDPADIALALLRGDWSTAAGALQRLAAHGEGKLAELAVVIAAAVQALLDESPFAVKSVENAVRRIERASAPPEVVPIRGALLVWLGRIYRDALACHHLAEAAFKDGQKALPDEPEPRVELAELARRAKDPGAAHRGFQEALELAPHRAGAHLGLAALHEDTGAWVDAGQCIAKAVEILARELDPVAALDRVAPSPVGAAYLRLAELVGGTHPELAIRALDRALQHRVRGPKQHALAEVYRERGRRTTPPGADDLYEAGWRFMWRGEYESAAGCFEEAMRARPDHLEAMLALSDCCRMRAFEPARAPADRVAYLTRALELSDGGLALLHGQPERGWMLTARAYVVDGLAEEDDRADDERRWDAIALTEHALILEPASSFHLTACSRLHRKLRNNRTSNALLARARQVAPADVGVLEDSVRVFANSSEFDRAMELIPKLPDTAWRRGVEAFIRVRQRRSVQDLELARCYLETGLQAHDPRTQCWMNLTLGLCCHLLEQGDAAPAYFEAARAAASSHLEHAETAIWCGDFRTAIEEARKGRRRSHEEYFDFTALLAIAQLGAGEHDEAMRWFDELVRGISGPHAANWRTYIKEDLEFLPAFAAGSEQARKLRADVVEELAARASSAREGRPPRSEREALLDGARQEIDELLETARGVQRRTLLLTRARLATEQGEHELALARYRELGDERAARDGLAHLASKLAALAARRSDLAGAREAWALAQDRAALLVEHLEAAFQAAILLDVVGPERQQPLLGWLEDHLGLAARPRDPMPALTLTIPEALVPTGDEGTWPLLTRTIPEVRRILQVRFGLAVPAILVQPDPDAPKTCRLWIGMTPAGSFEIAPPPDPPEASIESIESLKSIDSIDSITIEDLAGMLARSPDLEERRASTYTRVGGWLVHLIGQQLQHLVGVQDVVGLLETWGASPHVEAPLIRRTGHLVRLTRLVRMLLAEQIALTPWQAVTDATRRWRKRSLDGLLAQTRLQLRPAIRAAIDRAGGAVVPVPGELERRVSGLVRHDGANGYLAAPSSEIADLLASARQLLEPSPTPVLMVGDVEARAWLRRLVALEAPSVLVVARDELPPSSEASR